MSGERQIIRDRLLTLRNAVKSAEGEIMLAFGKDYMVEAAADNLPSDYIKGMGLLLDYFAKAESRLNNFIQAEK